MCDKGRPGLVRATKKLQRANQQWRAISPWMRGCFRSGLKLEYCMPNQGRVEVQQYKSSKDECQIIGIAE